MFKISFFDINVFVLRIQYTEKNCFNVYACTVTAGYWHYWYGRGNLKGLMDWISLDLVSG